MVRKAGLLILGLAVMALTGCSSNKNTGVTDSGMTSDQTGVQTAISYAPEVATDGLFATGTASGFSSRPAGPLSGIDDGGGPETGGPVRLDHHWWREITGATGSFTYEFTGTDSAGRPTSAHIVVHKHFTGTFHVAWDDTVPGDPPVVTHQHLEKPLKDHWVRHLWLARLGDAHEPLRRGWRLVAASGVNVTSETEDAGPQPAIQSIRVQTLTLDHTFTDPAAAITWSNLIELPYGTPVTVTVTTNAPDDVVVLMHHDGRAPLTANGDNTYTGSWNCPGVLGLKHFGVNALSNGTLYDANGGYHSHAWLFPFLRTGEAYGS
jgi:hypothetical protein